MYVRKLLIFQPAGNIGYSRCCANCMVIMSSGYEPLEVGMLVSQSVIDSEEDFRTFLGVTK